MKISLKSPFGNVTDMEVKPSDTVAAVKARIQAGMSARVIFAGTVLDDTHSLEHYHIQKGCTLFLVPAQGSGNDSSYYHAEAAVADWWETFAVCANEIDTRSTFYHDFDEEAIDEYMAVLNMPGLSYDQLTALSGLKLQLGRETTHQDRKGCYLSELDRGLKNAIEAYEVAVKCGTDSGPFIIHPSVPFLAFDSWYMKQENKWRIAFQFTDSGGGVALLYGDPSFLHEAVAQWFQVCLVAEAAVLGGSSITKYVQLLGSSRIVLPTGAHKEPDFSIQPVKSKLKIPPFVGEIAYANESLTVLQGELIQWTLAGGAAIAYGVKMSLKEGTNGESVISLRFLERRKGDGLFCKNIDFSPEICTAAGDPNFLVEFPLRLVFDGATIDQRLLNGVVKFDLYQLQQRVVELLENGDVAFVWHPKRKSESEEAPLLGGMKDKKPGSNGLLKRIKGLFR